MDEFYKFPSKSIEQDNIKKGIQGRFTLKTFIGLFVIAAVVAGVFLFKSNFTLQVLPINYAPDVYRLVPEKISQSAEIRILLPASIDPVLAQRNIKFNPEINGSWQTVIVPKTSLANTVYAADINYQEIIFKPSQVLDLNRHYLVELAIDSDNIIKEDFLVVENPKIIAVFPNSTDEAPESSEITVVFNRPMVPLTTLSELENKDVPIEIIPVTKGRFKWITTSNLQFIPENGLIPSSNYTINVKPGFVSIDGLAVQGSQFTFTTRNLRFISHNDYDNGINYNQPLLLTFNQSIDLNKTANQIIITENNQNVLFRASYYKGTINNDTSITYGSVFQRIFADIQTSLGLKKNSSVSQEENKSIIQIIPITDKFGRSSLWNFNSEYSVTINKAFPISGNINIEQPFYVDFYTRDFIDSITATSERTRDSSLNFFDPQGKLWIRFIEDINLGKSIIKSSKLQGIGYGQKCSDPKLILEDKNCQKVDDKKSIFVSFNYQTVAVGEVINLSLEKIINADGLQINQDSILETIQTYPIFNIYSINPKNETGKNGSDGADLKEITICSNTPLQIPKENKDLGNMISSENELRIDNIGNSYLADSIYSLCQNGEYDTRVSYLLDPSTNYQLKFYLNDVFGQYKDQDISFKTRSLDHNDREFYTLQGTYNVTSPKNTKLTFGVKNLDYVNLTMCRTTALSRLEETEACTEIKTVKLELPKRFWTINYFTVDVSDYFDNLIGHFMFKFSNPELVDENWYPVYSEKLYIPKTFLTVTNLEVVKKQANVFSNNSFDSDWQKPDLLFWVNDINTLKPVTGAKISVYQLEYNDYDDYYARLINSGNTNNEGVTKFSDQGDAAIITKGNDSTFIEFGSDNLTWADSSGLDSKTYIYTDKPIYRPGQTVYIKGICRVGYDGNYENCKKYQDTLNELKITNPKYEEILNTAPIFNNFGTFQYSFILDKASPLGSYSICLNDCSYFEVEEYRAASFDVKVTSDKSDYVSKDRASIRVEANYYFGLPVEKSNVTYSLSSQDYYFDKYQDEYFSFGGDWYYDYSYSYGDKFLTRGETELSEDGKANITLDLDLASLFKTETIKSKILVLDVTVTTPQGQSVSQQKSFIVHAGDYYLGTYSDSFGLAKNQKTNLKIKSVNTEGKPISINNITMKAYRVNYIYAKRQNADGGYTYDWNEEKIEVSSAVISTDSSGNASKEIQFATEGEYIVETQGKDRNNNIIQASRHFYVYGESAINIKPYEGTKLDIKSDKTKLSVGDTATVIIQSPYPNAKALISLERGKIFSYEIVETKGNIIKYTFPIKEEYFPNIFLSVLLQSNKPEVRYGSLEFKIGTNIKGLNIDVKTDKKTYLPGEKVRIDVTATNYLNQPVATDISVAVVDLSVLALKGNPKKNPVQFFYGGFPLTISTGSNIKHILEDVSTSKENSGNTKGGGGYNEDALAKKARGVFMDTAYWQATLLTNIDGKAFAEFTLPDNLTTWQIEALGVTQNTELGVGYSEITSKKPLMITSLKPRFIIPGDNFEIGAKVFNQSTSNQTIETTFTSTTLELKGKIKENFSLAPGKSKTVYFKVAAPLNIEEGTHSFNILTKGNNIEDQVNDSINITPSLSFETTATAGYTNLSTLKEYIFLPNDTIQGKGDVTIKTSATLGVFLSDGLKYLINYPYGCSEQIASRLYGIAIVKEGLSLPNINPLFEFEKIEYNDQLYTIDQLVQIGLNKIYINQNYDGGFVYWPQSRQTVNSDPHLTAHIIETFKALSNAGFSVSKDSVADAQRYLEGYLAKMNIADDYDKNTFITLAYALADSKNPILNITVKNKLIELSKSKAFINDKIGTESLAKLTLTFNNISDQKNGKLMFDSLSNRIRIDSRGAFLEPLNHISWRSYETTIKDTALYLKAVALYKADQPIIDKVLRWLINAKASDGSWGSTNNTLAVVDGMVDYLKFKKETESNFDLKILVNKEEKKSITFGSNNIFDQSTDKISLNQLMVGKTNVVEFLKNNLNKLPNNFYYDMALKYYLPAGQLPPRDEGISISRSVFKESDLKGETPINKAGVGEILRVSLVITIPKDRKFVAIEDYIPAGTEIVNMDLATEQKSLRLQETELIGREIYPDFKELRDNKAFIFKEEMYPGVYQFDYFVRAFNPGQYAHLPAMAYEMYTPENFGRTGSQIFTVE
jgi:uncharacterized protein YfaS (alpha-2-macroglobulin family)